MKVRVAILVLGAISLVFAPIIFADDYFRGAIMTADNKIIIVEKFAMGSEVTARNEIPVLLLDTKVVSRVPVKEISRIIIDKFAGDGVYEAVLFTRDGRSFRVHLRNAHIHGYDARDPISGTVHSNSLSLSTVRELRFATDWGNLKKDEKGNLFPPDYIYSPYTGKEMILTPIK